MITIKIDKDTFMQVDFEGILTPAEEEVFAYKAAGKNAGTIAAITGKSSDAVQKQLKSAYRKTNVSGIDNPSALLSMRAVKNGWISICNAAILAAICTSTLPAPMERSRSTTRASCSRIVRRDENSTLLDDDHNKYSFNKGADLKGEVIHMFGRGQTNSEPSARAA